MLEDSLAKLRALMDKSLPTEMTTPPKPSRCTGCSPLRSLRCARSCSAPSRWSARQGAGGGARARATRPRGRDRLLARLTDNESVLVAACELLTAARRREPPHRAGRRMAARQLLPDRRADPHRQAPPAEGLQPRAAAPGAAARRPGCRASTTSRCETISHGDGRLDADSSARFVAAYQTVAPLQARRAVGDPDHAAAGADREPAPRRRARRRRARAERESRRRTGPTG